MAGSGDTTHKLPAEHVIPLPAAAPLPLPDSPRLPSIPGFELRRELGRGGMGVVYEAWSLARGELVALKALLPGLALDPELVVRLEREAGAQARLDHPNIVPVLAAGREPCPWLAMELVAGETLEAWIRRAGPLPAWLAADWCRALAGALEHAHARGVLHRDLKPANVLIDADRRPRLSDFGLARLEDRERLTLSGAILGSPAWMAPEQARGGAARVDARADVYGLGAVLYEMLTGVPPYRATSQLAALEELLTREPERPSALRPGVDPGLEAICLRAMARDPERRYPSAAELAAALAAWEARGEATRRRSPLPLLLVGGVAALGVGVGALLLPSSAPDQAASGPARATPVASPDGLDPLSALRDSLRGPPTQAALHEAVSLARRCGLSELTEPERLAAALPEPEQRARLLFAFCVAAAERDPQELVRSGRAMDRLATEPDLGGTWPLLARAILRSDRGESVAAAEELARALEGGTDNQWEQLTLATLLSIAGEPRRAAPCFQAAQRLDERAWLIAWFQAWAGQRGGDRAAGLDALARWDRTPLEEVPAPVLALRARLLGELDQLELAWVDIDAAVRVAPPAPWVLSHRADLKYPVDPLGALEDLLRIEREVGGLRRHSQVLRRGMLDEQLGDWHAAAVRLISLLGDPDCPPDIVPGAAIYAARSLAMSRRLSDARTVVERFRGQASLVTGEWAALQERLAWAERAERRRAELAAAPVGELEEARDRASREQDWSGALAAVELLLQHAPEEPDLLLQRASLRRRTGDPAGAVRDFEQVLALGLGLPAEQELELAGTLGEVGQWRRSIGHYREVLSMGELLGARVGLAQALVRDDRPDEALEALRPATSDDPAAAAEVEWLRCQALIAARRWDDALALLHRLARGPLPMRLSDPRHLALLLEHVRRRAGATAPR